MVRIALVVSIMRGTALSGSALLAVLIVPDLFGPAMKNIPVAALIRFAADMLLSHLVARKIARLPAL